MSSDFNADGILDLAVASEDDRGIAVLIGNGTPGSGDGTFLTFSARYLTGTLINSICVGDFNSDGITDLVTGSWDGSHAISVLLGRGSGGIGDGTFASAVSVYTLYSPTEVVTGDFNSDGIIDLAAACYNSSSDGAIAILLGQGANGIGDGTFASAVHLPISSTPFGIVVSDFNQDGIDDIASANYDRGTVTALLGQGAGGIGDASFAPPMVFTAGFGARHLIPADFNGDGILDVAVAKLSDVAILTGLGSGGVGTGSFSGPVTYALASGNPGNISPGDFDRDGHLDLAMGGAVLLGTGGGQFESPVGYPGGTAFDDVAVGDFNTDGRPDMAFSNYLDPTVRVALNTCLGPDLAAPRIVAVQDIPLDEGGKAKVSWSASGHDHSPGGVVTNYRVWRSVPPNQAREELAAGSARLFMGGSAAAIRTIMRTAMGQSDYYWEFVAEQPAAGFEGYSYVASTTSDSVAAGNPMTAFLVQARSADGSYTWNSEPDSGYSVDNLPPRRPRDLAAELSSSGRARLHWLPNYEADLSHYAVYAGPSAEFAPGPENMIGTSIDTTFVDAPFTTASHYKVLAIDVHDNHTDAATLGPQGVSGVGSLGVPRVAYIRQNRPNPFNPSTTIEFGVATEGHTALRVMDARGRLVRVLVDRTLAAGNHRVAWDGKDSSGRQVASGVYIAELVAPRVRESRKMVLTR